MKKKSLRIKEARDQHRLSQVELAEKVGVSAAAISQYETGAKYPTIETLQKLAEVLEVSMNYLVGEKDTADEIKFRGLDKMPEEERKQILKEVQKYFEYLKSTRKRK